MHPAREEVGEGQSREIKPSYGQDSHALWSAAPASYRQRPSPSLSHCLEGSVSEDSEKHHSYPKILKFKAITHQLCAVTVLLECCRAPAPGGEVSWCKEQSRELLLGGRSREEDGCSEDVELLLVLLVARAGCTTTSTGLKI